MPGVTCPARGESRHATPNAPRLAFCARLARNVSSRRSRSLRIPHTTPRKSANLVHARLSHAPTPRPGAILPQGEIAMQHNPTRARITPTNNPHLHALPAPPRRSAESAPPAPNIRITQDAHGGSAQTRKSAHLRLPLPQQLNYPTHHAKAPTQPFQTRTQPRAHAPAILFSLSSVELRASVVRVSAPPARRSFADRSPPPWSCRRVDRDSASRPVGPRGATTNANRACHGHVPFNRHTNGSISRQFTWPSWFKSRFA